MTMYIYESHLGGIYFSEYPKSEADLYCETCGDWDMELGQVSSTTEALQLLAEEINFPDGHGGYDLDEILSELSYYFDDDEPLDRAQIENIILATRTEGEQP